MRGRRIRRRRRRLLAPQVALPNSPNGLAVRYFYERRNYAPVWFKRGRRRRSHRPVAQRPAPRADRRHGQRPASRGQRRGAVAAAVAGDEMKHKEAELALSAAWVDYVQALQRPNNNVIWGDPSLTLKPSHPDRILALLAAAPSARLASAVGVVGQSDLRPAARGRGRRGGGQWRPRVGQGDAQHGARAHHPRDRQVHPRQLGRAAAAHVRELASRSAR